MTTIHAIVVDPSTPERLVIREVASPTASPSEALVRVKAISLNRGEVRTAFNAEAGWRPGWGTLRASSNSRHPTVQDRVLAHA